MEQLADAAEMKQMRELGDRLVGRSRLAMMEDGEFDQPMEFGRGTGKQLLMGDDPRLPAMPAKPTIMDFLRKRVAPGPTAHLLQSANLAQKNGLPEKMVLACLLHDFAVAAFIRSDHGYWGAQLLEPYVDEEVSWAIKYHQALRFYPDESVGYAYPGNYVDMFGEDYEPADYIKADYETARKHKWYMSARQICVNDLYSFDPNVVVKLEQFEDIIGRHFKQPKEGLGHDGSPVAHMWRTIVHPSNAL
jgi:hypothetical protein